MAVLPANLVTRAELARLANVTRAAITKACRRGLAGAVTGAHVDLEHPAVAEYLAGRALRQTALRPRPTSVSQVEAATALVAKALERLIATDHPVIGELAARCAACDHARRTGARGELLA